MPTDPIESPEAVGELVCDEWCGNAGRDGATLASIIATAVRSRDAAVRREAIEDAIAAAVASRRASRLLGESSRSVDMALDNIRDLLKRGRLR